MDAAFELFAAPAATACVRTGGWHRCAGFAADAGVTLVIEREARDGVLACVGFDAGPIPICEDADLLHHLAAGELVVFDLLQTGTRGRLLTAQAGEPPCIRLKRAHQRLDLTDRAALCRLDNMQQAELTFVLCERRLRQRVDEVEVPFLRDAVAVFDESFEVIAGLEEYDGHMRQMAAQ